jgi:hypothetical protein
MRVKFVCKNCGAVNEKEREIILDPQYGEEDWLCDLPLGFEWILPVGKISPIVGTPLYVSSQGGNLSREEYLSRYNVDPEIAYQLMRKNPGRMLSTGVDLSRVESLISQR